jgi:hypothetical protein
MAMILLSFEPLVRNTIRHSSRKERLREIVRNFSEL